jgi:hypothetical protein
MKKEIKKENETDAEMLARIVLNGFEQMNGRIDRIEKTMVTKDEFNDRCDRIEHILYRGHENRIEKLEDKIAQIQVILGKKLA